MLVIYWKDCQLQTFHYIRSSFVRVISTHSNELAGSFGTNLSQWHGKSGYQERWSFSWL